jgi:fructokinase
VTEAARPPVDIGIEIGGTKVIVGASASGRDLVRRDRIETTDPASTLAAVRTLLAGIPGPIRSVGVASFGPLDLRPSSERYGTIISTPKPGWSGVDLMSGIIGDRAIPVGIDTDVNAALRAEHVFGAAGTDTAAYLTVGTGIGGGIWTGDGPIVGMNHSELGHLNVRRHPDDDFPGVCPYHRDCLEGMAAGPAIEGRFGRRAEDLSDAEAAIARELVSFYVANGIVGLCSVVPVERVVIGGGLSHLDGFHEAVRVHLGAASGSYPPIPFASGGPEVVPPTLGDDAGVIGAVLVAIRARSVSGG